MNVFDTPRDFESVAHEIPAHYAWENDNCFAPDRRVFMYAIDENDCIEWVNNVWREFAKENDAPELAMNDLTGRSIWEFIGDSDTRILYELFFDRVRTHQRACSIPMRCDSHDTLRLLHMTMLPQGVGGIAFRASITAARPNPHAQSPGRLPESDNDIMEMCSFCKRARVQTGHWLEPELALSMRATSGEPLSPQLSHSICRDCWPEMQRRLQA